MPEELDIPEVNTNHPTAGAAPGRAGGADPLSIEPDPLSIKPDPPSSEPETLPAVSEPAPAGPAPLPMDDDEPISLVDESDSGETGEGPSMVRQRDLGLKQSQEITFKRALNLTGTGATRCRLFHCRVAVEAIENMQERINMWIDDDDIEIKHVSQVLAVMEGKNPKPNIVITVWF